MLWRYVDGETAADESAEIYGHLQACGRCAERLESLRAVDRDLNGYFGALRFDDALVAATMRKLQPSARLNRARPARSGFRRLAVAAAILFAVGAGFLLLNGTTRPRPIAQAEHGLTVIEDGVERAASEAVFDRMVLANLTEEGLAVRFEDGSRVTVAPGTRIQVSTEGSRGRVSLVGDGVVFLDVERDRSHFKVLAGSVDVTVLGTRFSVERSGEAVQVRLFEGSVRVDCSGRDYTLTAGQQFETGAWLASPIASTRGLEFYELVDQLPVPAPTGAAPAAPTDTSAKDVPPAFEPPDWPKRNPYQAPPHELDRPIELPHDHSMDTPPGDR